MTHDFDNISYLLKKAEWPEVSHALAFNIRNAAIYGDARTSIRHQPPAFMHSPLLSFMAIVLSMIIGIASGTVTSVPAKAKPQTISLYEGADTTLAGLYTGTAR